MGRVSKAQAEEHRAQIVTAASELFRERGIDGVSVPELMGAVGLTQGGFYRHFASKEALAAEACTCAIDEQVRTLEGMRATSEDPEGDLVAFYLSAGHRMDKARGCPMAALSGEVSRTPVESAVRSAFAAGVADFAGGVDALRPDDEDAAEHRRETLARFSMMVGALTLARATEGSAISDEILEAARVALAA